MCINGEIGSGGLGGGADCAVWLYERAVGVEFVLSVILGSMDKIVKAHNMCTLRS